LPLDSEDRKLFKRRARSDDGYTSFKSVEYIGYHTPDGSADDNGGNNNDDSDDDATKEFSDEVDW
jgi:hypothetical protein